MADKGMVIWGLGDQFRVLAPIVADMGFVVVAGVDDTSPQESLSKTRFPVVTNLDALRQILADRTIGQMSFCVCVANPYGTTRVAIADALLALGLNETSVISTQSTIVESAKLGMGIQVLPRATVHLDANVERQVIVNTDALVEHDCVLEQGSEVGPGAVLCGRVILERYSWVGAGAVVLPRLTVGANAVVGAGAVVTRDVKPGTVVAGNPARALGHSQLRASVRHPREFDRIARQLCWTEQDLAQAHRTLCSRYQMH